MRKFLLRATALLLLLASPAVAMFWSVPEVSVEGVMGNVNGQEAPATGVAIVTQTDGGGRILNFWWVLDCGNGQDPIPGAKTDQTAYAFVASCNYPTPGTYTPSATLWMGMGPFSFPVRRADFEPVTVDVPAEDVSIQGFGITASGLEPFTPTVSATAVGPAGAVTWALSCNGDDGVYETASADTDDTLASTECGAFEATTTVSVNRTICATATIGEETSPKACAQFTTLPQVLSPTFFACFPSIGETPLSGVSCSAAWGSNGGDVDLTFKCSDSAECPGAGCHQVDDFAPLGPTGSSYSTLINGAFTCPDYTSESGDTAYTASVLIEDSDGKAPSITMSSTVTATAAPVESTFGIRFLPAEPECQIAGGDSCSVVMNPHCTGTALGDISNGSLDCGTDGTASLGTIVPAGNLGANLEQWSYWESGMPYCDRAKQASLDPSNNGGWSRALGASNPVVDDDGWPISFTDEDGGADAYIYTLINRNVARVGASPDVGHYPDGEYTLTCTGTGTIGFGFDASGSDCTCPDTCTFDVSTPTASGGIPIQVKSISEGPIEFTIADPTSCTGNWRSEFLSALGGLRVLRFMDWMRTNWDPPGTWANRVEPSYRSWACTETGCSGVPVETMVDLANTAHIEPWFTLPDTADDEYVQEFADYVCGNLDPTLRAYVELGNEIWNFGNPFFNATNRAAAAGAASPYNFTDNIAHRWKIARSMEIWSLFEATAGCGDARVVNVLGLQNADPPKSSATFMDWDPDYVGSVAGAVSDWVEAVAVAPYWNLGDGEGGTYSLGNGASYAGIANADCTASGQGPGYDVDCCTGAGTGTCPGTNIRDWTPAQFHESMLADIPEVLALSADHAANLAPYGIPLIAYEGGNHVTDSVDDTVLDAARYAAHKDEGMSGVLAALLAGWRDLGGELFVYFQLMTRCSISNCWGAAEFIDELDDPLYVTLMEQAESGCANDALADPTTCSWTSAGSKTISDSGWTRGGTADSDATTSAVEVTEAAVAELLVTCPTLTFEAGTGEAAPSAKECQVTNIGTGTLASTNTETSEGDASWVIGLDPASQSTTTETDTLTVSVPDPDDLDVGTYVGKVRVENDADTGNAFEFDVTYEVQSPPDPPVEGEFPDNDPSVWGYKHPDCPSAATIEATTCSSATIPAGGTLQNCTRNGTLNFGGSNITVSCVNVNAPSGLDRAAFCTGECRNVVITKSTLTGAGSGTPFCCDFIKLSTTFGASGARHTMKIEKSVLQNYRVGVLLGGGKFLKDSATIEPGYAFVARQNIFRSPVWGSGSHSEHSALVESVDGALYENNVFDCQNSHNGGNACNTSHFLIQPSNGANVRGITIRGNRFIGDTGTPNGYEFTINSNPSNPGNPTCAYNLQFHNNVIERYTGIGTFLFGACPKISERPGSSCTGNTVNGSPADC